MVESLDGLSRARAYDCAIEIYLSLPSVYLAIFMVSPKGSYVRPWAVEYSFVGCGFSANRVDLPVKNHSLIMFSILCYSEIAFQKQWHNSCINRFSIQRVCIRLIRVAPGNEEDGDELSCTNLDASIKKHNFIIFFNTFANLRQLSISHGTIFVQFTSEPKKYSAGQSSTWK
jgi:hypothetical protein